SISIGLCAINTTEFLRSFGYGSSFGGQFPFGFGGQAEMGKVGIRNMLQIPFRILFVYQSGQIGRFIGQLLGRNIVPGFQEFIELACTDRIFMDVKWCPSAFISTKSSRKPSCCAMAPRPIEKVASRMRISIFFSFRLMFCL